MIDVPKLLFLVSEDWYFVSHRLELAREAKSVGYDVVVVTKVNEHGQKILSEGFNLIPISMIRNNKNPFTELRILFELIKIYKSERPDIVHHVALKPIILGSIATCFVNVPKKINALTGLGYVFSSDRFIAKLLKRIIKLVLKLLLSQSNSWVIFQNPDDQNYLINEGIVTAGQTCLIKGSGVDPQKFYFTPEPKGPIRVILASRMLWDKGIKEFVEAAHKLKPDYPDIRFLLVGDTDDGNFASVPLSQLLEWHNDGFVEWCGKKNNIQDVLADSHIVCLPSAYGEGVPKVLIEAASCGRPIVTTDSPGCREIVLHEKTGLLVPIKDSAALAEAIRKLITDPKLRKKMGEEARKLVIEEFSLERVIKSTLKVYSLN